MAKKKAVLGVPMIKPGACTTVEDIANQAFDLSEALGHPGIDPGPGANEGDVIETVSPVYVNEEGDLVTTVDEGGVTTTEEVVIVGVGGGSVEIGCGLVYATAEDTGSGTEVGDLVIDVDYFGNGLQADGACGVRVGDQAPIVANTDSVALSYDLTLWLVDQELSVDIIYTLKNKVLGWTDQGTKYLRSQNGTIEWIDASTC